METKVFMIIIMWSVYFEGGVRPMIKSSISASSNGLAFDDHSEVGAAY